MLIIASKPTKITPPLTTVPFKNNLLLNYFLTYNLRTHSNRDHKDGIQGPARVKKESIIAIWSTDRIVFNTQSTSSSGTL